MPTLSSETIEALNAGAPEALAERRRNAFGTFQSTPLPTSKDEAWRYVEVDLDLDRLELAGEAGAPLAVDGVVGAVTDVAGTATVVDGYLVDVRSDDTAVFGSLIDAWARGGVPALVDPATDRYAAAAGAFLTGGVVLQVPPGVTIERPYVVDVQVTQENSLSVPHVALDMGENSEATVVMVVRGADGVAATVAPQVSQSLAAGSRLRWITVQEAGDATKVITHQRVQTGRDAVARLSEAGLGGAFSRTDLGVRLVGRGSSVESVGLFFGERRQVFDYRMVIDHVGPKTSSDVFLKGAVEDDAQSVFTGLLRIEENAAGSRAFETNRNLVLSDGAKAHSVPNLEILCDDVVCGHGSSVGPWEKEHLYYLLSRGLRKERAERLLLRGFFQEALDRLPIHDLSEPIRDAVIERFVAAQDEGRVA